MNLQFWTLLGVALLSLLGVFSLTAWALDRLEDERARIESLPENHVEERHLRIVARRASR